jgi:hypothetical protein
MLTIKNLPFLGVVGDGVASLELPIGMTYNRIYLKLGGTTFAKSNISRIVLKINGKIFFDISGTNLDLLNDYKGMGLGADYLCLDFIEAKAKTVGGQYIGAIGTLEGVTSFIMEVTISGATAPTLESWSEVSSPAPMGLISTLISHTATYAAAGEFPLVLPHGKEAGLLIQRVLFYHTNMTELEVKKNGVVIFESMPIAVNSQIQTGYGRTPQAGLYVYDTIINNDVFQVLDTTNAQSLSYNITVSASDTITVLTEAIADLSKI